MTKHLSPIQKHIIAKLKNADSLRYSELQPENAPNDLFNYHLKYLIQKDFVTKLDIGYSLSKKGIKHVADPYPTKDTVTSLFKMNVITIVSRVVDGQIEILNQERKSNPSYGKIGVMGGVVEKGERIGPAATRKLKQETGLDAKFSFLGSERRIMYKSGELFSDLVFVICYTDKAEGKLLEHTDFGNNVWVPIEQAIKHESAKFDSIKSIRTVLKAIKDGSVKNMQTFFEEEIQDDSLLNE
jgi:ADP-ribose pyrophosphatase YjhB (NUDIX family)